jgi:excisionase family DNA binding protein
MTTRDQVMGLVLTAKNEQLEAMEKAYRGNGATPASLEQDCRLLTFTDAAKTMNVSRPTIWRMCKSGLLPCIKIRPGTKRVPFQAIKNLLAQARKEDAV